MRVFWSLRTACGWSREGRKVSGHGGGSRHWDLRGTYCVEMNNCDCAPACGKTAIAISRFINQVADFSSSGSFPRVWGSDRFVPLAARRAVASSLCVSCLYFSRESQEGDRGPSGASLLPPHSSQWHIHVEEHLTPPILPAIPDRYYFGNFHRRSRLVQ